MKFRKSFVTIAAMITLVVASPARAETLADALTYAYNHSGLLDQNSALLRAADEDVAQAVASTLPVISWAANASISSPRSEGADLIAATASISGQLTIYDSGSGQLGVEAQKELVLGTRQSLRSIEQNILLGAVSAYMQVRADSEFVALRQSNVRVITQEFRAAQDRFDVGEVTRTDVALAEARLAAARSLLASAQGSLARSAETYRNAVGRSPSGLQPAQPAPVSKTIADAKAYAMRNHPSILEVQHSVSAAELNIRRGEAAFRPTVTLNGEVGMNQDGIIGRQVGVNVRGPIYAGGALSSQVRQLMARRDAARAQLHIVRHNLEQQVGNAYSFLDVARASRQAINQQIRAARVAFRGVREEATLGARTTIDVLNAEQELLNAQADLIAAQSDEVIASYQVLSTMGLLTAEHLRLPVQQYDPAAYYNLVKDAPTITSDQGQALDRVLRAIGQ
ncbi:MAG: TolC family outer membrane protein [Yoonia sp.]|nr:TolC family outer membrane protein [Yoonia sp.]